MSQTLYASLQLRAGTQQIRLLSILPCSKDEEEVACRLDKADLTENPQYFALSYVWGDATKRKLITVNDFDLSVTESLARALRDLRSHWQHQRFWIDAICINQLDYAERAAQVSIMCEIYGKADKVIARLDTDQVALTALESSKKEEVTEWTEASTDSLRSLASAMSTTDSGTEIPIYIPDSMLEEIRGSGKMERDIRQSLARMYLGQNKYWKRTWVVQELLLAREVIFIHGSTQMPFTTLESIWPRKFPATGFQIISGPDNQFAMIKVPTHLNTIIRRIRARKLKTMSVKPEFLHIVSQFREWRATDPRDKLWAFLGLCSDGLGTTTINYLEANTAAQVYLNFAQSWIGQHKSLQILQSAGVGYPELPEDKEYEVVPKSRELSSWVPNWANNTQDVIMLDADGMLYHASGDIGADTQFSTCGQILYAKGIRIDSVHDVLQRVAMTYSRSSTDKAHLKRNSASGGIEDNVPVPTIEAASSTLGAGLEKDPISEPSLTTQSSDSTRGSPDLGVSKPLFDELGNYALKHKHWTAPLTSNGGESTEMPRLHILLRTLLFDRIPDENIRLDKDKARAFELAVCFCDPFKDEKFVIRPNSGGDAAATDILLFSLGKGVSFYSGVHITEELERNGIPKALQMKYLHEKYLDLMLFGDSEAPWAIASAPLDGIDLTAASAALGDTVYRNFFDRTLFVTESGYLGAGWKGIEPGDIVAILFGCGCPVILRKVDNHYVLLGVCFIQGFMDGKAVEQLDQNSEDNEIFEIR